MIVHLTHKSSNAKTGPIPVSTTERKSCPPTCSWYDKGCYASYGPLGIHWRKVGNSRGGTWAEFCRAIAALPEGQLWRHNAAGDLPGTGNRINRAKLDRLVRANSGRRGFSYTHKPMIGYPRNRRAVEHANANGLTVNLSADNLGQADALKRLNIGPVVVVLPSSAADTDERITTPDGHRVVVCPATKKGSQITCATCGICAYANRKAIIGFPAHGAARKHVSLAVVNS